MLAITANLFARTNNSASRSSRTTTEPSVPARGDTVCCQVDGSNLKRVQRPGEDHCFVDVPLELHNVNGAIRYSGFKWRGMTGEERNLTP